MSHAPGQANRPKCITLALHSGSEDNDTMHIIQSDNHIEISQSFSDAEIPEYNVEEFVRRHMTRDLADVAESSVQFVRREHYIMCVVQVVSTQGRGAFVEMCPMSHLSETRFARRRISTAEDNYRCLVTN